MKTSQILSGERNQVVNQIAEELMQFKSYQEGLQNAEQNAEKRYEHAIKMHTTQRRWWKVVETSNGNFLIWTNNSRETVLVTENNEVIFYDELTNQATADRTARELKAAAHVLCTRKEIIEKVISRDFNSTRLLPPVSMF
ncbi:hypothetical protein [Gaoshiqia sediminis]|uniref:Uncharacterized protein n=1 Tax=Gaoshiqia sediminis TaxID=2986998 RepID=A0AA42CAW0_9BACT|nr:hypothetical protein [Gaoshiqia sediminis]MCW0484085.1 hypothetical protein [Gaoshiqia sediminis]